MINPMQRFHVILIAHRKKQLPESGEYCVFWKILDSGNCGNCLAVLKLLSKTNKDLKSHLSSTSARNVKYISLGIENESIRIISYDIWQIELLEEFRKATFYAIMADEVESIILDNCHCSWDMLLTRIIFEKNF